MHANLLRKTKLSAAAVAVAALSLGLGSGVASAGGGTTSYVNDPGPCATDWQSHDEAAGSELTYPVDGAGAVRMFLPNSGAPYLRGICTNQGVSATGSNVSGGVSVTFTGTIPGSPKGKVTFLYKLGKTEIRYY